MSAKWSRSMKPGYVTTLVRWFAGLFEETLNAMLDAEAGQLCGAGRYEDAVRLGRMPRAGSYEQDFVEQGRRR